jgi:hypothetical protein
VVVAQGPNGAVMTTMFSEEPYNSGGTADSYFSSHQARALVDEATRIITG